jgi:hypothetical protein
MKRLLIPILLVTGVIGYLSCQKDNSNSSGPSQVQAVKTEGIKKGEPVLFSIQNVSTETPKWSVTPAANVQLTSNGNKATILFRNAGTYSVVASVGATSSRVMVSVNDSSYCDSTRRDSVGGCPIDTIPRDTCSSCINLHDTTLSLAGDLLNIGLSRIDSGSLSGLRIVTLTHRSYPCVNNTLAVTASSVGTSYSFFYAGIRISGACYWGHKQGFSERILFPIPDGTHAFSVVVNNTIYSGSFTKTGNQYSFTWPYTSGVVVSPLNL